jgi:hypothetical protein
MYKQLLTDNWSVLVKLRLVAILQLQTIYLLRLPPQLVRRTGRMNDFQVFHQSFCGNGHHLSTKYGFRAKTIGHSPTVSPDTRQIFFSKNILISTSCALVNRWVMVCLCHHCKQNCLINISYLISLKWKIPHFWKQVSNMKMPLKRRSCRARSLSAPRSNRGLPKANFNVSAIREHEPGTVHPCHIDRGHI